MSQSLAKILIHVVFATKERIPFLRNQILREELHRYLGGILSNRGCQPISVGGPADHVHLLAALSRTEAASELIKELKRGSGAWLKANHADLRTFAWQNGFGIFSIGLSQVETLRDYIARQEEHHRRLSFQEEYLRLLRRYEIAFDERYLWD